MKHDTISPAAAAVHIACADLILAGYRAFPAPEGMPYDVVLDAGGHLYRVQVKGTAKSAARPSRPQSPPVYRFMTNRNHRPSTHGEKAQIRRYDDNEIDILACVAIDLRVVAYFRVIGRFMSGLHLYPPNSPSWVRAGASQRRRIDEFPIGALLAEFGHRGPTELRRLSWEAA